MREDASGSLATEARAVSSSSASSAAAPIARSLRCSGVLPAIGFGASTECSTHLLRVTVCEPTSHHNSTCLAYLIPINNLPGMSEHVTFQNTITSPGTRVKVDSTL